MGTLRLDVTLWWVTGVTKPRPIGLARYTDLERDTPKTA
jgi:hypothetical protein